MLSLLGWLPIVGPIIDGIVAVVKGRQDTGVKHAQIEAGVTVEAMKDANQLTLGFMNDIAVRISRDIIMFPGSVYCGTYIWDRWIEIRYPDLVWGVKSLQGPMEYLPYALLTFFFGSAYLYWKRK
jgi:hypothetical protein